MLPSLKAIWVCFLQNNIFLFTYCIPFNKTIGFICYRQSSAIYPLLLLSCFKITIMFFILRQNSYIRIAVEHTFQVSVLLTLNAWMIHSQIFILCLQKCTFALDVTEYITTHFEIEQCFNLKTIIFFICCILPNDKRYRR
jgi:hypothetical protein